MIPTTPCRGHAAESERAEGIEAAVRMLRLFIMGESLPTRKEASKHLETLVQHIQRGAVPEGWKVRRDRGAIVVEHPKVGGYAATADSESIASTILYEFANAMLAAAPAPDQFRGAAKMVPVHCTPTEHEGRIVYEHTSEPIPNADGFVLYAASADRFRAAAKMMAVQPSCMTCNGHGMVGGRLPSGGGYQADQCPDCTASVPAEVPVPESIERLAITRYRTRPKGMFGCEVVAGDGSRSLFEGSRTECCSIARKLTEAFLDGAHIAIANFISASGVEEHNHTQAEVPMPEPVGWYVSGPDPEHAALWRECPDDEQMQVMNQQCDDGPVTARPLVLGADAKRYGDDREAAGYARGRAAAGRDAEEWGNALNKAGWAFSDSYRKHMGGSVPTRLFNNAKAILRDVIAAYIDAQRQEEKR